MPGPPRDPHLVPGPGQAKLLNAPCFIPNVLAGPYWVVAAGPSTGCYEWAIVAAGEPKVQEPDGACSTSTKGTNGAGLWLFTRAPTGAAVPAQVAAMRKVLTGMGFSLSQLRDVPQKGCLYAGANIKRDWGCMGGH